MEDVGREKRDNEHRNHICYTCFYGDTMGKLVLSYRYHCYVVMGIPLALNPNADLGTVVPNTFMFATKFLFYVFFRMGSLDQGRKEDGWRGQDLGDAHFLLALHLNLVYSCLYKKKNKNDATLLFIVHCSC